MPQRWRRRVPVRLRNALVERFGHPVEPFDPAAHPRRVNLGCGFDVRPGWLNVDVHAFHGPDLVADVRALPMLPSGSYEEALAQDVLEHLRREDAPAALREWWRLLAPGGRIHLRVPDLPSILRWLGESEDPDHHRRVLHYMFGTQAYDGDFHYSGYTDVLLCDELFSAGFGDVRMWGKDGWMWEVDAIAGGPRVGLAFGPGFDEPEDDGTRWAARSAELALHAAEPVSISLRVTVAGDAEAVRLGEHALEPGRERTVPLDLPAGVTRLELLATGGDAERAVAVTAEL